MKRFAKFVALSVVTMSFALTGNALAEGTKSIVNRTGLPLIVVALPRTVDPNDVVDNEPPVFLVVPSGATRTLTYSGEFLNQFLVIQDSYCAVTVNTRTDSGDNTMNTNSILTITDRTGPRRLDCMVTGSNP